MLGKNHAVVGCAVWLTYIAVSARSFPGHHETIFPDSGGTAGSVAALGLSTIVAAGSAVLPDLDEPEATAAKTFGAVGRGGAKTLRWFAGGHRQRTHTLAFAALVGLLGWWAAGIWTDGSPAYYAIPAVAIVGVTSVWGFLLVGRAAQDKGLSLRIGVPVAWMLGCVAAALALVPLLPLPDWGWAASAQAGLSPRWWLPAAMGVGCAAHLLGDWPTKSGVPALWPLTGYRFRLGLFQVGGAGEKIASIVVAVWAVAAGVLAVSVVL